MLNDNNFIKNDTLDFLQLTLLENKNNWLSGELGIQVLLLVIRNFVLVFVFYRLLSLPM
jgi:hypothetical protein